MRLSDLVWGLACRSRAAAERRLLLEAVWKIGEGGCRGVLCLAQALHVDPAEPRANRPDCRKTKCYPSDLTDEEWDRPAPLMPKLGWRGRLREVDFREVINAERYLVRLGCGWRMLPINFGAW